MNNQFWINGGITLSEETSNNLLEYVREKYHNPTISFERIQNEILENDYYLCCRKHKRPAICDTIQIIRDEYFLGEYIIHEWIEVYPLWSSEEIGTYNSDWTHQKGE